MNAELDVSALPVDRAHLALPVYRGALRVRVTKPDGSRAAVLLSLQELGKLQLASARIYQYLRQHGWLPEAVADKAAEELKQLTAFSETARTGASDTDAATRIPIVSSSDFMMRRPQVLGPEGELALGTRVSVVTIHRHRKPLFVLFARHSLARLTSAEREKMYRRAAELNSSTPLPPPLIKLFKASGSDIQDCVEQDLCRLIRSDVFRPPSWDKLDELSHNPKPAVIEVRFRQVRQKQYWIALPIAAVEEYAEEIATAPNPVPPPPASESPTAPVQLPAPGDARSAFAFSEEALQQLLGTMDPAAQFDLRFSEEAASRAWRLLRSSQDRPLARQLRKALRLLRVDPRYPSLRTHQHNGYNNGNGTGNQVYFTSYVNNNSPNAYRIVWTYDREQEKTLFIYRIIGHGEREYN